MPNGITNRMILDHFLERKVEKAYEVPLEYGKKENKKGFDRQRYLSEHRQLSKEEKEALY